MEENFKKREQGGEKMFHYKYLYNTCKSLRNKFLNDQTNETIVLKKLGGSLC